MLFILETTTLHSHNKALTVGSKNIEIKS